MTKRLYLLPAIAWAIVILALLLTPSDGIPSLPFLKNIPFFDKWVHGFLFAVLGVLISLGVLRQSPSNVNLNRTLLISIIAGLIWALLSEFLQLITALGRSADYFDILADTLGLIAGIIVFLLVRKVSMKRKRTELSE